MLLNGGELDGVRLVSPKTLELMSMNHLPGGKDLPELSVSLFSEATYGGVGFGLGFAVSMSPARALIPGSPGDVLLGRPGEHVLLGRSARTTDRHLHDAAHAVRHLSDPARAAHARLLRVHLNACRKRTPSVSSAAPATMRGR